MSSKTSKIIYSVSAGVTVILCASLLSWAGLNSSDEVTYLSGELEVSPAARTEYLIGEEFDPTGIDFIVDGKTLNPDEYTITNDFSNAGSKMVTYTFTEGNKIYNAYYPVEVYMVRHIDVRNDEIYQNSSGEWDTSGMLIWAELSGAATEFTKPVEYPNIDDTVIVLPDYYYSISVTPGKHETFYQGKISLLAGPLSYSFNFTSDPNALVDNEDRILDFINADGGKETLTLYVTKSSNNFNANITEPIEVEGIYVFNDGNGNETRFNFAYAYNPAYYQSTFKSSQFNQGLVDMQGYTNSEGVYDGDAYQVKVNGCTFYALGSAWHLPILNWR